jgi:hypothetical protein
LPSEHDENDIKVEVEKSAEAPAKITAEIVSLWTFIFDRLITAAITVSIIALVAGEKLWTTLYSYISVLTGNKELLQELDNFGLKNKLWIGVLLAVLSALYINANFIASASRWMPYFRYLPLARPNRDVIDSLARLWATKPEFESYTHLQLYVTAEISRRIARHSSERYIVSHAVDHGYLATAKEANRACLQVSTALYFALFAVISCYVARYLGFANQSARYNAYIIFVLCIGVAAVKVVNYVILWRQAHVQFIYRLIEESAVKIPLLDWTKHNDKIREIVEESKAFGQKTWVFGTGIFLIDYTWRRLKFRYLKRRSLKQSRSLELSILDTSGDEMTTGIPENGGG